MNNNPFTVAYSYTGSGDYASTLFYSGNATTLTDQLALRISPWMAVWLSISGTVSPYQANGYTPNTGTGFEAVVFNNGSLTFHQKIMLHPQPHYLLQERMLEVPLLLSVMDCHFTQLRLEVS